MLGARHEHLVGRLLGFGFCSIGGREEWCGDVYMTQAFRVVWHLSRVCMWHGEA